MNRRPIWFTAGFLIFCGAIITVVFAPPQVATWAWMFALFLAVGGLLAWLVSTANPSEEE